MQAAFIRVKLPYLNKWSQRRFEISQLYVAGIRHGLVTLPRVVAGSFVGHLFLVRSPHRDGLREHLKQNQIMSEAHYPVPDYRQPAFSALFQGCH